MRQWRKNRFDYIKPKWVSASYTRCQAEYHRLHPTHEDGRDGKLTGGWTPSSFEKSIEEERPKKSFWASVADIAVVEAPCWAGAKAAAEPARAARTATFIILSR